MQQGYRLVQQQVQRLALTQTLQQAIAILQMSTHELWELATQAITDNPLLEWPKRERQERARLRGLGRQSDAAVYAVAHRSKLDAVLREQLAMQHICERQRRLVDYLIDCLDERGYLSISEEEIAAHLRVPKSEVLYALWILQGFEPHGVGARSLQECLLLQLNARMGQCERAQRPLFELAKRMLTDDLTQLRATGSHVKLAQKYHCSETQCQQAIRLIQSLDPRPGWQYAADDVQYIYPDVIVTKLGTDYVVTANDLALPQLRLSEEYTEFLNQKRGSELRDYVARQTGLAQAFVRGIEARKRTVQRVAEMIVHYQRDYFEFGDAMLKPLTLKMVADELGLHESTVSRAVSGKYAQTPRGIFELKHFFSARLISSGQEEGVSAASVKAQLKFLIDRENRSEPFTDQQLADQLKQSGIRVSRRTIAKYREELNIPNSAQRRQVESDMAAGS
ncbi:RNA polymerase factor sigma-54 [Sulfoacidibacillus thermotolerans]|uniref:RNA polymerase sigma-54 factor n=1 Tax=Sulfoacidibacillus thermotolerans TaxID=1765684 RepID=A0A2U3D7Z2_SULT2|nr:RNA polymerase factor sigma-54 [Sulfoacidibacillus thermotolerans]PWI57381.1 RNA polymerase sigma-54 factor [Sulfoacidibacillus thermotolerans]